MYSNEHLNAIHYSNIGFEFEFFSNEDTKKVKDSLSKVLSKRIRIKEKGDNDFLSTSNVFKMEADDSDGTGMIRLVTSSLPFPEAKLILSKVLKWIRENGSTDDRCSMHINISFNVEKLGPILNMSKLNIGKFVINFDEDKVYDAFPDRKDSVYAKSIKFIMPFGGMTQNSLEKSIWKNYMYANEDYHGINFTSIPKGYITFKYLGGPNYEKKYTAILSMIEYFIVSLYETLTNPIYSKEDLKKINEVLEKNKKIVLAYRDYKSFKEKFSNITLLIDLKTDPQIVEMYYPKIREKIFELLTNGGMTSGLINYDSDSGRIQIKDVTLNRCFSISNVDIVNCTIKGTIKQCDIFNSEINNSSIQESNLFNITVCNNCTIENCYVSKNTEINNCYVFGKNGVFSGDMIGGVFRIGRATKFATFSDDTKVIEVEKINM